MNEELKCSKCGVEDELKHLNGFWFLRTYASGGEMPQEAYKEFTRREFLKAMDRHFEDFKMSPICASCLSSFEWDLGRVFERYGSRMTISHPVE